MLSLFATLVNLVLGAATAFALWRVLSYWTPKHTEPDLEARPADALDQAVFLFDNQCLVDATPSARCLLWRKDGHQSDWERLMWLLSKRFSSFRDKKNGNLKTGEFESLAEDDAARLEVEAWDSMIRLTIHDDTSGARTLHPLAVTAMEAELGVLRRIAEESPQLTWIETDEGEVSWVNRSYLAVADRINHPNVQQWPPARLFPTFGSGGQPPEKRRLALQIPSQTNSNWYDVYSLPHDGETLHFAVDAIEAVTAEEQGRMFIQTLTKTFSQLSIGIAVFDRKRELVMFNPALLDLTGLSAEFLLGRPRIRAVLDNLRNLNMIPEPRNYASWREEMAALEAEAAVGTYAENWTLPGGKTYRVTGRPHPDGAIAFMFEDISDEVSLTRNFRTEIETAQSVIDALEDAIIVVSPTGTVVSMNTSYHSSWKAPQTDRGDVQIADEISHWRQMSQTSAVWDQLLPQVMRQSSDCGYKGTVDRLDGQKIEVSAIQLEGGMTMIRLRYLAAHLGKLPSTPLGPKPLAIEVNWA